jgi:PAS domain S-box-containing protein
LFDEFAKPRCLIAELNKAYKKRKLGMATKKTISRAVLEQSVFLIVFLLIPLGVLLLVRPFLDFQRDILEYKHAFTEQTKQDIKQQIEQAIVRLSYDQLHIETRMRAMLQEQVHTAHAIATKIYEQNKNKMSDKELRSVVRETLRVIRYNDGRGYFFAGNFDGIEQLFADKPELEGKNLLEMQDTNGKYVIRDMIEIARSEAGEAFYNYTWTKPGVIGKDFPKLAFIQRFKPFDWFIGTGEYLDTVEAQIQAEAVGWLDHVKFGKDNYLFAFEYGGTYVAHVGKNIKTKAADANYWDLEDVNGVLINQELQRQALRGGGFVEYVWHKPSTGKATRKLAYAEAFEPWNWVIGTGIYLDDVEKAIAAKRAKMLRTSWKNVAFLGLLLTAGFLLALLIAMRFSKRLKAELTIFQRFFRKASSESETIAVDHLHHDEFKALARTGNEMLAERKQAKETLRDSEEHYKTLVDTTDDGMAILKDGSIVFASKRFCEILDRLSSDILGSHFSILFAKDELARIDELHERYLSGESGLDLIETEVISPDGSSIGVEINGARFTFEGQESVLITLRDITKRKRAEEALQQSEEKYRLLADNVADTIWIVGLSDMRFSYISPAAEKILGYTPAEVLDLELSDFMTPETLGNIALMISEELTLENEEGAAPGKTRVQELEQIRKDGSIIWTEITARFLRDGDGRPDRILGVTRDITERKRVEAALRTAEETYRNIFLDSPIGLFRTDVNSGFLLDANDAVARFIGFESREQLLAEPFSIAERYVDPLEREKMINLLKKDGAFRDFVARFRRNDGSIILMKFSARLRSDKGWLEGVSEDITERTRAKEALRESESKLLEAQDITRLGYFTWEIATGSATWSKGMYKLLKYAPDDQIDFETVNTNIHHPDDLERVTKWLTDGIESGDVILTPNEYRLICKNKDVIWVQANGRFEYQDGKTVRLFGTCQDITDRKRAEEEKIKLEGQLRQAQKMEAVGRLAGGVAHDFNNILTAINGYAEMIIQGLKADDSLRPNMEVILSSGKRAAGLTAQLLAFSRKQIIAPRVIQPNDILLNSQKMLRRIIGEDIDFIFAPGGGLWRILADPTQLDQVLMNLAVNARDAMPHGGKLTIETQNATLDDEYCQSHVGFIPGDYVMLAVTDTGHGMDAETLENIFEPFFSTKEVGKGTGLGLAMVYGVMKQNNGFINVYSEIGEGTTFKIYYPALKEKAEKLSKDKLADMPAGTETVLLVEDEGIVRNLAKTVLERQGYTVIDAPDGKKARLEYTQYSGEIHLLLTDVVMPKMNGGELYKKLLDLKPGLKALFMSGYTEDAIAHHGVLDKGAHFIQKPFTIQALAKAVRKALDD